MVCWEHTVSFHVTWDRGHLRLWISHRLTLAPYFNTFGLQSVYCLLCRIRSLVFSCVVAWNNVQIQIILTKIFGCILQQLVLSLIIIVARLACVWSVLALHALPDPFLLFLRRMTFSFAELALTLNDLFHYA